jgi:hypothetical protein
VTLPPAGTFRDIVQEALAMSDQRTKPHAMTDLFVLAFGTVLGMIWVIKGYREGIILAMITYWAVPWGDER